MICRMYSHGAGDLILVPDCMLAPREAVRQHGPLTPCGSINSEQLPVELAGVVERELDARSFSYVPARLARRLGLALRR